MDTDMRFVVRLHAKAGAYFPGRERFLTRYERGELPAPQTVARRTEHLDLPDVRPTGRVRPTPRRATGLRSVNSGSAG